MDGFCLMAGSALKKVRPLSVDDSSRMSKQVTWSNEEYASSDDDSETQDCASRVTVEELNRKWSSRLEKYFYTEVSSSSVALG